MWKFFIFTLCVTGISAVNAFDDASSASKVKGQPMVRRFACPVGFFRLKRFCYYLSGGVAPWKEAYFNCRDRNASLVELDRKGKDRTLRRYLMDDKFTKLERWIGGIFNWRLMVWEWGVRGENMQFQNFAKAQDPDKLAWHCTVLDPTVKYKWSSRSCYDKKHYICQVPARRIVRRRKKMSDPDARHNQRLSKFRKKGKRYYSVDPTKRRKSKQQEDEWASHNKPQYQQWAHGVNLGSRQPYRGSSTQNRSNELMEYRRAPVFLSVEQVLPKGMDYGAFRGNGGDVSNVKANSIGSATDDLFINFHSGINDIAREEILIKP